MRVRRAPLTARFRTSIARALATGRARRPFHRTQCPHQLQRFTALHDITAKQDTGRAAAYHITGQLQHLVVIADTGAAGHQNGCLGGVDDAAERVGVTAPVGFDDIRTQFRADPGMHGDMTGIEDIVGLTVAGCHGFHHMQDAEFAALCGDAGINLEVLGLDSGIQMTDEQIGDHSIDP